MAIKLSELAKKIQCDFTGEDCLIENVADINHAKKGDLAFISNIKYRSSLSSTKASAVISKQEWLPDCMVSALVSDDPRLAFAKAATLLNPPVILPASISPSAIIDPFLTAWAGVVTRC